MSRSDELKHIIGDVIKGGYTKDEFEVFDAEYGYQDWMNNYLSDPDADTIPETESDEIDSVVKQGFDMAFDPEVRKLYNL